MLGSEVSEARLGSNRDMDEFILSIDCEEDQRPESEQEPNKFFADPPLLEKVRRMAGQSSCHQFIMLQRHSKIFCSMPEEGTLANGSGCSGSGTHWYVLEIVSEAFALQLSVRNMNVTLLVSCLGFSCWRLWLSAVCSFFDVIWCCDPFWWSVLLRWR